MGSDANYLLQHIYRYVRFLEWELIRSRNTDSRLEEFFSKRLICIRNYIRRLGVVEYFPNPLLQNESGCTFADLVHSFRFSLRPSHQQNFKDLVDPVKPLESGRYLCLSVGFAVCCLDLKQSKEEPECSSSEYIGPPLPIISIMSFLEEVFPISMGMFKIGSGSYMIGGQELLGWSEQPKCLWDPHIDKIIHRKYGVKGSSRRTYYLSPYVDDDDDDDDTSLSLYECDFIPPLIKPKTWPIVERIGNQIHVIDSVPGQYGYRIKVGTLSHEVLDLNDLRPGWTELSYPSAESESELDTYICQHIVAGNRIYARLNSGDRMVLDCETNKWASAVKEEGWIPCYNPYSIHHVYEIMDFGFGRCVDGVLCEELEDMYDVVFAVRSVAGSQPDSEKMVAEAYLINKKGQVVCFKRFPSFFEKVEQPFDVFNGKVIPVDEVENTWCVVCEGVAQVTRKTFIFISTFSFGDVNVDNDTKRESDGDPGESDFIELNVKECYVFDKEAVCSKSEEVQWASFL